MGVYTVYHMVIPDQFFHMGGGGGGTSILFHITVLAVFEGMGVPAHFSI